MITLPKPPSRPTGMPQRRRKSGLRTAAGTLQEQFLARLRMLRDDPTLALPAVAGDEPRPLARLRRQLEAMKDGKVPLAARFDRHVAGAVHMARRIAGRDSVPRLMDAKIAGQRRFYLQVGGHVNRACSLGVQNWDQPRVLLLAYSTMAKRHGLHFFATDDDVVCTGRTAQPPAEALAAMAADRITLREESTGAWGCGHADRPRVELRFTEGPTLSACGECGKRVEGLHKRVRERYVGPRQRHPVDVAVTRPDGSRPALGREALARYRAGLSDEAELIRSAP